MFNENGRIPVCPECGQKFDNVFEAVWHMLEDDEQFDPAYILPGNIRLMLGSLMWSIYKHRNEPEMISELVQDCYATLAMAEFMPEQIPSVINDILVEEAMEDIDDELKRLLKDRE
jgi:hypothetical protein